MMGLRHFAQPFATGVLVCAVAVAARAQAPAVPAPAAPAAAPAPALPSPPPNFQYSSEGRRDPFIDLVNRGTDAVRGGNASAKRPDGVPGLETASLLVKGILQSRGGWLAMVSGADGKVYTIRAGDKLFDGVVRTVTAQAVVILQEVNDPLSLEKQREVRKFLRGGEEVK
jgi:Tfp pilus assembly protein PilP